MSIILFIIRDRNQWQTWLKKTQPVITQKWRASKTAPSKLASPSVAKVSTLEKQQLILIRTMLWQCQWGLFPGNAQHWYLSNRSKQQQGQSHLRFPNNDRVISPSTPSMSGSCSHASPPPPMQMQKQTTSRSCTMLLNVPRPSR